MFTAQIQLDAAKETSANIIIAYIIITRPNSIITNIIITNIFIANIIIAYFIFLTSLNERVALFHIRKILISLILMY